MPENISPKVNNKSQLYLDLLETIQSDIKFFTKSADGSFSLEPKSVAEIKMILGKLETR